MFSTGNKNLAYNKTMVSEEVWSLEKYQTGIHNMTEGNYA
jgi:hypothetical protein